MPSQSTPLRRSTRKRKAVVYAEQLELGDVDNDDIVSPQSPSESAPATRSPSHKKARPTVVDRDANEHNEKAPKKRYRVRGRLAMLLDMPLDILYEIFSFLHPLDLLHISRTTKSLRSTLMNKRAIFIWKNALTSIKGLPACPPDLNEPQFASLAFENKCYNCGKQAYATLWELRMRICNHCVHETDILFDQPRFASMVPVILRPGFTGFKYLPYSMYFRQKGGPHMLFLKADVMNFVNTTALLEDEQLTEFLQCCARKTDAIKEHAEDCKYWDASRTKDRRDELQNIRKERKQVILQKLRELGWSEEVDFILEEEDRSLLRHPEFHKPRPLTDRAWNKIQPELVIIVQNHRTARLEHLREKQLCDRVMLLAKVLRTRSLERPKEMIPGVADVAHFPEFREILEAPFEEQVAQDSFTRVLSRLPRLTADWSQKIDEYLVKFLPAMPSFGNIMKSGVPGVARLWLATTFFQCARCRTDLLQYPRVLVHACFRGNTYVRPSYEDNEDHSLDLRIWRQTTQLPWTQYLNMNKESLTFDKAATFVARQLILACKKDPDMITAGEMDSLDARFVCPLCTQDGENLVLSWTQAVLHAVYKHNYEQRACMNWAVLNKRLIPAVQELEKAAFPPFPETYKAVGVCRICPDKEIIMHAQLSGHYKRYHTESDIEEEEYCDLFLDSMLASHRPFPVYISVN